MGIKYLVTGGLGVIGRYLCRELLASGYEVRVIDSLVPQVHGPRPGAPPEGVEVVYDDLRDADAVRARERLGFEPCAFLEDSLEEFADWVRTEQAADRSDEMHGQLEARGLVS